MKSGDPISEKLGNGLEQKPSSVEPARSGDVRVSLADITRAREELVYEPTVHFAEGLERTIAWMKSTGA